MASIEKIIDLKLHPDPEVTQLEIAKVLGYECVVKKDFYKLNDLVVLIYPDNVLPDDEWAVSYKKYAPIRVKAIKLRSFVSFGIIVDKNTFPQFKDLDAEKDSDKIGLDVAEIIGVKKYESPIDTSCYPNAKKGTKPGDTMPFPKTDEDRWQSLRRLDSMLGSVVDVSLKVDGTSSTYYYNRADNMFGATSRTMDLDIDIPNVYTNNILKHDLKNKLKQYCIDNEVDLAIRGETYGRKIQVFNKNPYCKLNNDIFFYSVFNMTTGAYEHKGSKHYFVNVCKELGLPIVPILEEDVVLTRELINKYDTELKNIVYDKCSNGPKGEPFEGVVIKGPGFSFKVINKHYDMNK